MHSGLSDRRGFTLLEILVALAVLSLVVVAVLKNNNAMIDNSIYLRDKTLAGFVASNKAADLELANLWVKTGTEQGEVVLADRRWFWTVVGKETPDPDMRIAEIEVRSENEEETALASLVIYLGRPPF
ncbi:MAG: type II secretion system minor pseudopilin GspI [Proteobacteria bacterium]|nr:type II secretion system minor pseudopilin GspI [Pseudomonadota bacterium]MBU1716965.1 type II secretion system minor pseudopilin GspI [Pseudomonadota bacterium]